MTSFVIAHLSDPHIGPLPRLPLRHLLNKRLTGAVNWHRTRAMIHDMSVLAGIIADIRSQNPDHVALTGDLVNVGYAAEFPKAREILLALGDFEHVSIIPGNHDAYIGASLASMREVFGPFMQGDEIKKGAEGKRVKPDWGFPYLRRRGGVALIGVNTGIPTAPFMATGRIGAPQRARLAAMLERAGAEGLIRIVMIHHPPLLEGAHFGRNLIDSREFEAILRQYGAELVLHGHNHRHSLALAAGPSGRIPVLGAGSASAIPGTPEHRAEYNLVRIDLGKPHRISIERRGLLPEGGGVGRLAMASLETS